MISYSYSIRRMVLVLVLEAFGLVEYEYEYRFTEYEYDQIGNLWVKSRLANQAVCCRASGTRGSEPVMPPIAFDLLFGLKQL